MAPIQEWYFLRIDEEGRQTKEPVALERWVWGAIFSDGTEMHQFDQDGIFHQIGEIDQSKLSMFVVHSLDNPERRMDMPFDPETMRLVYKYRNVHLSHFPDMGDTVRIYVFGYNKGDLQHRIFILPDDRIIVADRDSLPMERFEIDRGVVWNTETDSKTEA